MLTAHRRPQSEGTASRAMRSGGKKRSTVSAVGALFTGDRIAGLEIGAKIREHTAPLVWAEVVGPQVAGATEVLGIENGILRVSTSSAVWSHELTFYKTDILRRLNARLGAHREPAVKDILFQNRGLRAKREAADEDAPPALVPTPEELDDVALPSTELRAIEAGIAAISDEGLRDRLRRVRIADARLRFWRMDNGWTPCARCGDLAPPPLMPTGEPEISCARCRVSFHLGR